METTPPASELQYIAETARATVGLVHATWALVGVTLLLAGATIWFMYRQLQESKAATQLNLHLKLVNDFESEVMSAARSRVAGTLLRGDQPAPYDIESILDHLESVALYAHREMLDQDLVWNDFSYAIRCYWHELHNYVFKQRSLRNDKTLFEETEWLYGALLKEDAKRRALNEPMTHVTEDELRAFLLSEADIRDRIALPGSHS
jgi:hypothetical protein